MSQPKSFGFDNDTKTWITNVQANYGSVSTSTALAIDNMVVALKDNGIWSNIVELGPFAGDNLAAAVTKLKSYPGVGPYLTNVGFTSSHYQEMGRFGGISGDGASYLFTPLIATNSLPSSNNYSLGAYVMTFPPTVNRMMGYAQSGTSLIFGNLFADSTTLSSDRFIGSTDRVNATINGLSGMCVTSSLDTMTIYLRGQSGASNATVLGALSSGTSATLEIFRYVTTPYSGRLGLYHVGYGMTSGQVATFSSIVNSFQAALGRNVY